MNTEDKFRVIKSGLTCSNVIERLWYNYCLRERMPYIIVETKGKKATVKWDSISFSPDLDSLFKDNEDYIQQELIAILERHTNGARVKYAMTPLFITCSNIHIDSASDIAEEIYGLIINVLSLGWANRTIH